MIAFYFNCVSAHQLPLAEEVARLVGEKEFAYIDAGEKSESAQKVTEVPRYVVEERKDTERAWSIMESAEAVLTGMRDIELFERRAARGLKTYYTSERWFKPRLGALRMLVPNYRRMVKRFVKWANTDPNARVLAIGPWAKKDFLRMGVKEDKIVPWGYFVSPGQGQRSRTRKMSEPLKVLWAGRRLQLKRVEDIEKAVSELVHLKRVKFTALSGVSSEVVRQAMRENDTFIMSSNGYEGWGAVVSEALEEGMNVIGTYEAGASAAMLPKERLYHAGDVKALERLIFKEMMRELPPCSIGEWTAKSAANRLVNMFNKG